MQAGPGRRIGPLHRESWLAALFYTSKDTPMSSQDALIEEKVILQLVKDIGLENTRNFLNSLENEFQKRINNIRQAKADHSFSALAAEAHAFKSSAQVSGAYKLAEVLIKLENCANREEEESLALAHEALTLADLTRFAFLDVKLAD
jgi:HPt (histidine-containing phosphotransfer) domain-containing protein